MARVLTIFSILLALVLFPPAALALVSNSAVPGDATYGVKRKLEDGIIFFASFTPTTKAWFALERSSRRFKEAAVLLTKNEQASTSLTELVDQTSLAATQVTQISDPVKKAELINQLSQSITTYDQGLSAAAGLPTEPTFQEQSPPPTPLPTLVPTPTPVPTTTPGPAFSRSLPKPSPTTQPTVIPTPTPQPTVVPSPTFQPAPQPISSSDDKKDQVDQTRKELEKIKEKLEEEREKLKEQKQNPRDTKKETKDASKKKDQ